MPFVEERAAGTSKALPCGPICAARVEHAHYGQKQVAVITLQGMVSLTELARLNDRLHAVERHPGHIAGVLLLHHAIITATADEIARAEIERVRAGALKYPLAIVVAPFNLPAFKRYAWVMATAGVGREVFTDSKMARALRWARVRGSLSEAPIPWACQATRHAPPSSA
jgi:hypothetical protein